MRICNALRYFPRLGIPGRTKHLQYSFFDWNHSIEFGGAHEVFDKKSSCSPQHPQFNWVLSTSFFSHSEKASNNWTSTDCKGGIRNLNGRVVPNPQNPAISDCHGFGEGERSIAGVDGSIHHHHLRHLPPPPPWAPYSFRFTHKLQRVLAIICFERECVCGEYMKGWKRGGKRWPREQLRRRRGRKPGSFRPPWERIEGGNSGGGARREILECRTTCTKGDTKRLIVNPTI